MGSPASDLARWSVGSGAWRLLAGLKGRFVRGVKEANVGLPAHRKTSPALCKSIERRHERPKTGGSMCFVSGHGFHSLLENLVRRVICSQRCKNKPGPFRVPAFLGSPILSAYCIFLELSSFRRAANAAKERRLQPPGCCPAFASEFEGTPTLFAVSENLPSRRTHEPI